MGREEDAFVFWVLWRKLEHICLVVNCNTWYINWNVLWLAIKPWLNYREKLPDSAVQIVTWTSIWLIQIKRDFLFLPMFYFVIGGSYKRLSPTFRLCFIWTPMQYLSRVTHYTGYDFCFTSFSTSRNARYYFARVSAVGTKAVVTTGIILCNLAPKRYIHLFFLLVTSGKEASIDHWQYETYLRFV